MRVQRLPVPRPLLLSCIRGHSQTKLTIKGERGLMSFPMLLNDSLKVKNLDLLGVRNVKKGQKSVNYVKVQLCKKLGTLIK